MGNANVDVDADDLANVPNPKLLSTVEDFKCR